MTLRYTAVAMPQEWDDFMAWALPQLGLRWQGYRRVRGQVRKRLARRCAALHLDGPQAYRQRLDADDAEWHHVAVAAQITVSRLLRDAPAWHALAEELCAELVAGEPLRVWCAGCAGGEEAYSWALLWRHVLEPRLPGLTLHVVATDVRAQQLERARRGVYAAGTLREVPDAWRARSFEPQQGGWRVRQSLASMVRFELQDLLAQAPAGEFDVIACRNLAFTYFDERQQRRTADVLRERLRERGWLFLGRGEHLPQGAPGFCASRAVPHAYRRT